MSGMLLLVAVCILYGWGYDENSVTDNQRIYFAAGVAVLAFVAWCVEQIVKAIKEKNEQ